jgi:uncharacterized protein YprB with RNaseH-like and TPR domain
MKGRNIHRKPMFNKKECSTNIKVNKDLIKRTRNYIETEDQNRKWEDNNISQNMISSVTVSRLNAISAS